MSFIKYNKSYNPGFSDVMGLDLLASTGDTVSEQAKDRGWRYTGFNSLERLGEISNIRAFAGATEEERTAYDEWANSGAYADSYKPMPMGGTPGLMGVNPYEGTPGPNSNVVDVGITTDAIKSKYPDFFNKNDDVRILEPDEANETYGIDGQLKFSEPISNLEAYVLKQRKEEEIKFNFALDNAYGAQFWKGMGLELGMALVDPVSIPLFFIPPLGGAKVVSALGLTGSKMGTRAVTGGMAGFYGSTAVEPLIYGAATQEQANYGLAQSFMNITFGTVLGGGLHVVGGSVVDGIKYVRSKRHGAAFNTAVRQAVNGDSVEVSPIVHGGEDIQVKTPTNDPDAPAAPGSGPDSPVQRVVQGDSDAPVVKGATAEYKPHSNTTESLDLVRAGEKAAPLSGVKLKTALANSAEYQEAVSEATKAGAINKIAFRIKNQNGDFILVRGEEGGPLRLFDQEQIGSKAGDPLELGEKAHMSMLMHGVDMAASDIKYKGSLKFDEGEVTHIIDVENAVFNPKMNQNSVVVASPGDAVKLFSGDPKIIAFSDAMPAGKNAVDQAMAKFDEGEFLTDNKAPQFDEQLLDTNLQQTGDQAGTQKGGFFTDAATGQQFYVKYPKDIDSAKNEFLAATLYRMFGVAFPEPKLVGNSNGEIVGIASKVIPGAKVITPDDFAKLPPEVKEKFADDLIIDMFMGNWDVVGNAPNFNIMQMPNGSVIRIDPGGALIFRAQGGTKKINEMAIDEIKSMLDPKKNPTTFKVFQATGMTPDAFLSKAQAAAARIFETDQSEINAIIDILDFTPDNAAKLKSLITNRRQALTEYSPEFLRTQQATSTKKGTIVANSLSSAKKALTKMNKAQETKLTVQEGKVLKSYTGSSYKWMNDWLRGKMSESDANGYAKVVGKYIGIDNPTPAQTKEVLNKYTGILDAAIKKNTLPQEISVWRGGTPYTALNGVNGLNLKGNPATDAGTAKMMVGGQFKLSGFLSTGLYRGKAFSFGNSSDVKLKINLKKGMPALYAGENKHWSFGKSESEVILPHDTTFVVKSVVNTKQSSFIEVDAMLPGEKLPAKVPLQQSIQIAKKYQANKSNSTADIDPDDVDLQIDPNQTKETLLPNVSKDMAEQEQAINDLIEQINAEIPNMKPQYIKAVTKELDNINKEGDDALNQVADLYEAAKAAAVCVRGAA
tara:strand:- start:6385 stop:9909 length:3525 start_codon:yes stop_codon:yes gene_type:complete